MTHYAYNWDLWDRMFTTPAAAVHGHCEAHADAGTVACELFPVGQSSVAVARALRDGAAIMVLAQMLRLALHGTDREAAAQRHAAQDIHPSWFYERQRLTYTVNGTELQFYQPQGETRCMKIQNANS